LHAWSVECGERLPLHAWSVEGVHQLLDDVYIFDHMEQESFTQERTEVFSFYAWMFNLDLLPCSKTVTLFNERAGRSDVNGGPPPAVAPLSLPPAGREVVILVHLDHYFDWSPQPDHSTNSSVSVLPGSDGSSSGGHFPVTTIKMIYYNTLDPLLVLAGNSSRYQFWWAYQPIPIIYY
jgi:hypothetical protein